MNVRRRSEELLDFCLLPFEIYGEKEVGAVVPARIPVGVGPFGGDILEVLHLVRSRFQRQALDRAQRGGLAQQAIQAEAHRQHQRHPGQVPGADRQPQHAGSGQGHRREPVRPEKRVGVPNGATLKPQLSREPITVTRCISRGSV